MLFIRLLSVFLPCPKNLNPKKQKSNPISFSTSAIKKQKPAKQIDTVATKTRIPNLFITLPQKGKQPALVVVATKYSPVILERVRFRSVWIEGIITPMQGDWPAFVRVLERVPKIKAMY